MTENARRERLARSKIIAGMHGASKRFADLAGKLEYFAGDVTAEDIEGAFEMVSMLNYWATYEWSQALRDIADSPAEPVANAPMLDALADLPDAIKNQASEAEESF